LVSIHKEDFQAVSPSLIKLLVVITISSQFWPAEMFQVALNTLDSLDSLSWRTTAVVMTYDFEHPG